MYRHPRDIEFQKAKAKITLEFFERVDENNLTDGEVMSILSGLMSSTAKYAIRMERHGNYETPGGLAE